MSKSQAFKVKVKVVQYKEHISLVTVVASTVLYFCWWLAQLTLSCGLPSTTHQLSCVICLQPCAMSCTTYTVSWHLPISMAPAYSLVVCLTGLYCCWCLRLLTHCPVTLACCLVHCTAPLADCPVNCTAPPAFSFVALAHCPVWCDYYPGSFATMVRFEVMFSIGFVTTGKCHWTVV